MSLCSINGFLSTPENIKDFARVVNELTKSIVNDFLITK
jgi:hypothetical protein